MTGRTIRARCGARGGALLAMLWALPAFSQDTCPCPTPPPPGWEGSFGAGVALNNGNSDTRSYNLTADGLYDPHARNTVKFHALYLRSDSNGQATVDKAGLGLKDAYGLGSRAFLFGEIAYQRDRFKNLDLLLSPAVGVGYRLVDKERVTVAADAGVALAVEKLAGQDGVTKGALRAGQALTWKLSESTTLGEGFGALLKFYDLADAYYHVEVDLTTALAKRLNLRLAYVTDIKNKPALPTLKKRDSALLATFVFKLRPS